MRAHTWSATPLGPPTGWPQPLKTLVGVMLAAKQPMLVAWGRERTLLYNDPYAEILAVKHPAALGRDFLDVWSEARADLVPIVAEAYAGRPVHMDDIRLVLERRGYPEETHFAFSYTPVHGEDGAVAGLFCPCIEITQQVLARQQQAFRLALEERLRDLADPRRIVDAASEALGRHLGIGQVAYGEIDAAGEHATIARDWNDGTIPSNVGRHGLDAFGPAFVAELRAGRTVAVPDVRRDPRTSTPEALDSFARVSIAAFLNVPLVKNGRLVAVLALHNAVPRPWEAREVALAEEVAERTWAAAERAAAEARLRDSEAFWRTFFQNMHEGFASCEIVYDQAGVAQDFRYLELNEAALRLIGVPREAILGQLASRAIPGIERWWTDTYARVVETGEPTHFEHRIDSIGQWFEVYAYRTGPGRFGALFLNVTERRRTDAALRELNETLEQRVAERTAELVQAQEALRQSQKMEAIGQLTGGVAHDFNNLLTVIRSSASLLGRPDLPEEKRRRYVDAIAQTADRAAQLTAQLLAFARRQALRSEVFDAAGRVNAVADMLRTVLGARVELAIEAVGDALFVEADAGQFETALVNMAVNARDAMDGEGWLTITIRRADALPSVRGHRGTTGAFVAISVADTGAGIAPEEIDRIFEPFYTTKPVGKGTGLGLSQVYGFAKQTGGEIEVASEPGRGATFTLYLPRAEPPRQDGTPAGAAREQAAGRGRVLVVEDNAQVGEFAAQLLEDLGYEGRLAPNAAEALRLLEADAGAFDIVFSDVVMPGMDGVELGRRLRKRWPGLPVVLTSGYSHVLAEDARHGFPLLHKPYSVEDLSRILTEAIGR
ncbi:hybrid sensor histidine kinase/response regulator [Roseicella aquatilis]|uniref:histidine kinase n=2 Tax=Roseicella aquatilis TaxID=2527868 RepID=A0A4R4DJ99_9PROT|nr:hybrid sensor histidine kinase/response regulator [Roseicella aquatilis]